MRVYTCRHAHEDAHAHSQSTSKMAQTDLTRSLPSAARAVVTIDQMLPNHAKRALVDNVFLLSLKNVEDLSHLLCW